jgi:DNA helicase-2/ATP-dependent DNA helicase PcrA
MDFDDLLLLTYLLFQRRPDICKRYSEYFQYVLVDEYQDTNFAQHSIVYQLTHESQRVCVVGDDAQSIYSFRGANIDNILRFKELYNGCKIFKLEQNYRSTQTIVAAANSLIAHNERQIHKEVFSKNDKGALLEVTVAYSDAEEGAIVANKIMKMSRSGKDGYADFAILYRINAQSRVLEEALRSKSIPYRIYGGLSFYQRKEIKDIVAYFRLSVNSDDEEAFKRIVNYPARGIGQTTVGRILQAATEKQTSVWNIVSEPVKYNLNVNKSTLQKINEFHELMESFKSQSSTCDAYTLAMQIIKESGIMADIYSDTSAEKVASQENVQELLNAINDFVAGRREEGSTEYVSISDYLQEISLISDLDQEKDDDDRKVTLMTVHSAKGLEFKNVFIVGLEENLFPSIQSVDSPRALEEERRLLYVAITRAKSMCFLSYAKSRYLYGHLTFCNPSRFLHDIEPCYLDISNETSDVPLSHRSTSKRMPNLFQSTRRERPTTKYTSDKPAFSPTYQSGFTKPLRKIETHTNQKEISDTSSSPYPGLTVGQTIEHSRFGLGKIVRIEGSGDSAKATVEFRNAGTKQLLLKFARFNVIG